MQTILERLSLNRKLLVGMVCWTLLLALVLWLAHHSVQQVRTTSEWIHHTQEVRLSLATVGDLLMSAESAQRGYLLTGQERYFAAEASGYDHLRSQVERLKNQVTGNAVQNAQLARLEQLVGKRIQQLDRGVQLRREGGFQVALAFVMTDAGRQTSQQIRALLNEMSAAEVGLLTKRRVDEGVSLRRNFLWSAVLSVVTFGLLLLAYLLVRRENAARTRAARLLDEANANLEARVAESVEELSAGNAALKREVEQRAAAERELQRSHEELEARVRERTLELSEANASKSRFLSAASHDLRQPLHSLTLLNASLRSQQLGALAGEIVEAQRQSVEAMSKLVNSLLSISMLQAGVIHPQFGNFQVGELIEPLHAEFLPVAQARGLRLEIDASPGVIHSDATLLRQIVQNLLGNALRYTRHGSVRLSAHAAGAHVRLEVSDTGPGIPTDQLEQIFEEFHQLRPEVAEAREGFGLGLSIAHHLAKLLGIELAVRSEVDVGTTFGLLIPAGAGLAVDVSISQEKVEPEGRHGRILLVDDEAPVRNATELFLRLDGHEVTAASGAEEALQQLEAMGYAPDVIVSDYQLGGIVSGADFIEKARAAAGRCIPAVVLSGDMLRVKARCAQLPDCRVFHKPMDAEELSRHLRSILEREAGLELNASCGSMVMRRVK